jgi:site-specific DNA-methyltransferase (adenine-specific)/adenine-specific DNA-methyltransferase
MRTSTQSGDRRKTSSPRKSSSAIDTRVIYCGDNIDQLKKLPDSCIDLIYIDPPFNSNRNYEVFWGETKEKRAFEDRHESTKAYIGFMRPRCVELARVLKKTGSFYYHCDWHASHYVKVMLDQIFGENEFINEIVWCYSHGGKSDRHFGRKHDILFLYAKSDKYTFNGNDIRLPLTPHKQDASGKNYGGRMGFDEDGREYTEKWGTGKKKLYRYYLDEGKIPEDWWTDINSIQSGSAERMGYPTQKPLALLDRIIKASSNPNDVVLDAFCGCGTALISAQNLGRQWIGIDMSPTACRVMAKRLGDVSGLREDESSWRHGKGFVVRDLPWTEKQLRTMPPFEFENWAVIALGGIPNKVQVGDMGIDGRIYPVSSMPTKSGKKAGELDFMDEWYPIQVKQKDKAGRPDIDMFETAMMREDRKKGFFVSFEFSSDAMREVDAFFRREHRIIVPLTVKEILDEGIARKLA